jgi:hypothetical protein
VSGDLGEAADYILAERPKLDEDTVWAVLTELGEPPAPGADGLAADLMQASRPDIARRDVAHVLREWRAYASLAEEADDLDEG